MNGEKLHITIGITGRTEIKPLYDKRVMVYEILPLNEHLSPKTSTLEVLAHIFGVTPEEKLRKLVKFGINYPLRENLIVEFGSVHFLIQLFSSPYSSSEQQKFRVLLLISCLGILKKNEC